MRLLLSAIALFWSHAALAAPLICTGDSQTYVRPPLTDSQTYCSIMGQARGSTHTNLGVSSAMSKNVVQPSLSWLDVQVPQAIAAGPGCVTDFHLRGPAPYPRRFR